VGGRFAEDVERVALTEQTAQSREVGVHGGEASTGPAGRCVPANRSDRPSRA